jgi:hypothetical protein
VGDGVLMIMDGLTNNTPKVLNNSSFSTTFQFQNAIYLFLILLVLFMAVYRIEFLTAPPPSRVYVGPKKVYHSAERWPVCSV